MAPPERKLDAQVGTLPCGRIELNPMKSFASPRARSTGTRGLLSIETTLPEPRDKAERWLGPNKQRQSTLHKQALF